jgi:hypothetical protein
MDLAGRSGEQKLIDSDLRCFLIAEGDGAPGPSTEIAGPNSERAGVISTMRLYLGRRHSGYATEFSSQAR